MYCNAMSNTSAIVHCIMALEFVIKLNILVVKCLGEILCKQVYFRDKTLTFLNAKMSTSFSNFAACMSLKHIY